MKKTTGYKLEPIQLDVYRPLRDVVSDVLRQAIKDGVLKPGERLMEIRLAEELGVTGEEPEFLFAQRNEYHGAFHGKPFHDNEIAWV